MDNTMLGGKSIIFRLEMNIQQIKFGQVTAAIFEAGGDIIAIDVIQTSQNITIRDLTITVVDTIDIHRITETVKGLPGVKLVNVSESLLHHSQRF
jgi:malate dehydrogenase (oxaloacetate-decarboxylating)